jgi:hypothetical protein
MPKIIISDTLARRLYVLGREVDLAFADVDDSKPTSLRFASLSALRAVLTFYRRSNETKIYDRLFTLYCALADLESGIVHPVLKPKRGTGRTPDSRLVWLARSRVAAGIECLILSGMKKKAAVILAAVKYRDIGRLVRPGQKLQGCISAWHRDFISNRVTHPEATGVFKANAMDYRFGFYPWGGHDDATRRKYLRLGEQFLTVANEHAAKIITPTAGSEPE